MTTMKRISVAVLSALAIVGSLLLLPGVAYADTTTVPTPTPVPTPVDPGHHWHHDHDGGGLLGGNGIGLGLGLGLGDQFNNQFIDLGGVDPIDSCQYGSYDVLVNHYSQYRGRFDHLFGGDPRGRFNQLRTVCAPGSSVITTNDNGQCVTYRNDAIRYGNLLNDRRRDFNGLALHLRALHGGNDGLLSGLEIGQLRRSRGFELNGLNDWNHSYGQLQTICNVQQPPVQIVQEVPAPSQVTNNYYNAPASASTDPAPSDPAPLVSSGSHRYPSVAPNTGDGSFVG